MKQKPFAQTYWVHEGLLCAGCYPGDRDPATREAKLRGLLDCGIRRVLCLMEPDEKGHGGCDFDPYVPLLEELARARKVAVECFRLPIRDAATPAPETLQQALDLIDTGLRENLPIYLHCWGGHGRTSTIVACHLIRQGHTAQQAIDAVMNWRADLPKNHFPFENSQEQFVRSWKDNSRLTAE